VTTDNTLDPNETRDKKFDWTPQLGPGETIASATVTIVDRNGDPATNATVVDTAHTDTAVMVRFANATGTMVHALCRITTSTGEILDDTWHLRVKSH
jgi:hypothetical protein